MKIATASGPEMNELMEKKLSMETLEMICGGEGQDKTIWGDIILMPHFPIFLAVTKWVLSNNKLKDSEDLYWWIRYNKVEYGLKLTLLSPPAGLAFKSVSWYDFHGFSKKLWKALH